MELQFRCWLQSKWNIGTSSTSRQASAGLNGSETSPKENLAKIGRPLIDALGFCQNFFQCSCANCGVHIYVKYEAHKARPPHTHTHKHTIQSGCLPDSPMQVNEQLMPFQLQATFTALLCCSLFSSVLLIRLCPFRQHAA